MAKITKKRKWIAIISKYSNSQKKFEIRTERSTKNKPTQM